MVLPVRVWLEAPAPLRVTVPVPGVKAPALVQSPETVKPAEGEARSAPWLVMVTVLATKGRLRVELSRVVVAVSVALPMVKALATVKLPLPPDAGVMVTGLPEEFSRARLKYVQLAAPLVVPRVWPVATRWRKKEQDGQQRRLHARRLVLAVVC